MTVEARSLMWSIDAALSRVRDFHQDVSCIEAPKSLRDLFNARRKILMSSDACGESLERARHYALLLGWSQALRNDPELFLVVSKALASRLDNVSRYSTSMETDLRATRDVAFQTANDLDDIAVRSSCVAFANEVEQARTRLVRGPIFDVRKGDAQVIAEALTRRANLAVDGENHQIPGRLCRQLLTASVSILPIQHRDRYEEEFRAETLDLKPRRQLFHAARIFTRCWSLRRALE